MTTFPAVRVLLALPAALLLLSGCNGPEANGEGGNPGAPAATMGASTAEPGRGPGWVIQEREDGSRLGRRGQQVAIYCAGHRTIFTVPQGMSIHSSAEEPMDWDYALVAEARGTDIGIICRPSSGQEDNVTAHRRYLAGLRSAHDPEITMSPGAEFTLADGRKLVSYLYKSPYWGHRLVVIIPENKLTTTVELNAGESEAALRASLPEFERLVGSYRLE